MKESILTPKKIVSELDKHIVGQNDAKKAVAIALRNRWRRSQVDINLQEEIIPRNILMIGSTGVGKTEIARRLAKLTNSPFIKVEATRYTEVGYVGRDVEQIVRDLVEISIKKTREYQSKKVEEKVRPVCANLIVEAYLGKTYSDEDKQSALDLYNRGLLDDKEIEISVSSKKSPPVLDMAGGQIGMINLNDMLESTIQKDKKSKKKLKVKIARKILIDEECAKLLDNDSIVQDAIYNVENNGIIFIDEIDKITGSSSNARGDVSREGVQRDLLPLVEGTTVMTKHGQVKTNYILFIASGAFHLSRPSQMLPELQGRFPISVNLHPLNKEEFIKILSSTESNLIKQYCALLDVEEVKLNFTKDGIEKIAEYAIDLNENVENIGARRLQTILEITLEDISYKADDMKGQVIDINAKFVESLMIKVSKKRNLNKFIL